MGQLVKLPPILAGPAPRRPAVAIHNATRDIAPGGVGYVQGQFSADASVWLQNSTGLSTELLKLRGAAGVAQYLIPPVLAFDAYRVYVQDGGRRSRTVQLNQAEGYSYDSDCYQPGQVPKLAGLCLLAPDRTPSIRWQNQATGVSTALQIDTANVIFDKYELVHKPLPTMDPGFYVPYFTNGYGQETKMDALIEVRAKAADPLGLNVGWSDKVSTANSRLVIATSDRAQNYDNVAAAMQEMAAYPVDQRGPVLYRALPGSKYFDMEGTGLTMVPGVFFQGEGVDKTIVRYGWGDNTLHQFLFNGDLRHCGFVDMELVCVNENGQKVKHLAQYEDGSKMYECFFVRIKWTLSGEGLQLLKAQDRLLVIDSELAHSRNSTATKDVRDGPFFFVNTTNARIIGNTFRYNQGQTHYLQNRNVWEEGNTFIRDFRNQPTYVDKDGKTVGYDTRGGSNNQGKYHVSVRNQYYSIADASGKMISTNDGECKISEGGGGSGYQDTGYGPVTSSIGKVLTVPAGRFGNLSAYATVSIIDGTGTGQRRMIVANTATTLTIDREWDTPLDATSFCAVATLSLEKSILKDNAARDGIGAYFNGYRSTLDNVHVVGTHITNHDGIVFQTAQRSIPVQNDPTAPPLPDFSTQFNITVEGNYIENNNNTSAPEIAIQSVLQGLDLICRGTSFFGILLRKNRIKGRRDYVPPRPYFYNEMSQQGFSIANIMQQLRNGQFNTVGTARPVLGVVLDSNEVEGCEAAVYVNEGSNNTLIRGTKLRNVGKLKSSEKIGPYQHDDVLTTEIETQVIAGGGTTPPVVTPPTYSFTPADATVSRIDTGSQDVVNVASSDQFKTFLAADLANKKLVLPDGTYTDNYVETGTWTNVWLTSASNNTTITSSGYSVLLIFQGGATRTKVRVSHIKFNYTGTGSDYALLYWNELGTYTGLEIDHCTFSCPNGDVNAMGCSQYSTSSGSGGIAKDVYIHDNSFPNVGRIGIELLNQGYDQVRLTNLRIDNNTFGNLGLQDGRHGMAISLSGLIQRVGIKDNVATGGKYCIYELVNVLDVIAENNSGMSQDISTVNGQPSACAGWSVSKDTAHPAPKNIYITGGAIDVSGRPIQIYDADTVKVDGGNQLWKGHRCVQMNLVNSNFKALNLLIQSTAVEPGLELTSGTGNVFQDCKISNAGAAAAGKNPSYEIAVMRSGTSGNSFINTTTELGLQANGQPLAPSPATGADGRVVDQGSNNTVTGTKASLVA